jgi:glucose/mannose-6-phosphate isomerase
VGAPTVQVHTRGDSRLERVLSAVLLGDLVSIYMAILAGVDPTETPALSRLKQQL